MSKGHVTYTITVSVNRGGISEAALAVIPKLIRKFAVILKVKLALIGSVGQWTISATVEEDAGNYLSMPQDLDLTPEGNEDDEELH